MHKWKAENLFVDCVKKKKRKVKKKKERLSKNQITQILQEKNTVNQNELSTIVHKFNYNNMPIINLPIDSDSSSESDTIISEKNYKCKSAQISNCPLSIKDMKNENDEKNNSFTLNNTSMVNNVQPSDYNVEDTFESEILQDTDCEFNIKNNFLQNNFNIKQDFVTLKNNVTYLNRHRAELYLIDDSCYILLKHPCKLYFNGKITVTPVIGKVEILGYTVNKCVPAFSPKRYTYLCIESVKSNRIKKDIKKLISSGINLPFIKKIKKMESNISVVKLDYYDDYVSQFLQLYVSQQLYPTFNDKSTNWLLEQEKLQCRFYLNDNRSADFFRKSKEWKEISKILQSEPVHRTIVFGGKNVGKSTFLCYLLNKFLKKTNKIVYIDLDVGQSEFFVSGCVSATLIETPILGPNFTHLRKPEKCVFIGEINVSLCVERYLKAVKFLINFCQNNENFKAIPWVINTMGYTKSIGLDIAVSIIKLIQPTHLIQIISKNIYLNFENLLNSKFVNSYSSDIILSNSENEMLSYLTCTLKSLITNQNDAGLMIQPAQKREMMVLAYFSQMAKNTKLITDLIPYRCSMKNLMLVNTRSGICEPSVFNAKLIALCEQNTINNDDIWICLGFGIVRGIDLLTDDIYLLTPLKENELNTVNCIVLGDTSLPLCIHLVTKSTHFIPFVSVMNSYHTTKIPKRCHINAKNILKKSI